MSKISFPSRPLRSFAFVSCLLVPLIGCSTIVTEREQIRRVSANAHFTGPHPDDFPVHGIDVSKYQGDVNWQSVKQSGIKFAWIKSTEGGDHIDEKFQQNWQNSRAAGVPRGAYHFVYWCRTPAEQMKWFKENVPVEADALPPVLDVEAIPTSKTCKRKLKREEVLVEIRQMLAEMERHYHKHPIIYTTVDFYQNMLDPGEFSNYRIWVRSTKYPPHVPYGQRQWTFWQYQSDGLIEGVAGKVDRNAFAGDESQWRAFLSGK
jgi:lysozyme